MYYVVLFFGVIKQIMFIILSQNSENFNIFGQKGLNKKEILRFPFYILSGIYFIKYYEIYFLSTFLIISVIPPASIIDTAAAKM